MLVIKSLLFILAKIASLAAAAVALFASLAAVLVPLAAAALADNAALPAAALLLTAAAPLPAAALTAAAALAAAALAAAAFPALFVRNLLKWFRSVLRGTVCGSCGSSCGSATTTGGGAGGGGAGGTAGGLDPPAPPTTPKRRVDIVCDETGPVAGIRARGLLEKSFRPAFPAFLRAFATRRAALVTIPAPQPGAEDITTVTQEKKLCPVRV